MSACTSVSVVTGEPCFRSEGHSNLHSNAEGTQEWIDTSLDDFPNGLIVNGVRVK